MEIVAFFAITALILIFVKEDDSSSSKDLTMLEDVVATENLGLEEVYKVKAALGFELKSGVEEGSISYLTNLILALCQQVLAKEEKESGLDEQEQVLLSYFTERLVGYYGKYATFKRVRNRFFTTAGDRSFVAETLAQAAVLAPEKLDSLKEQVTVTVKKNQAMKAKKEEQFKAQLNSLDWYFYGPLYVLVGLKVLDFLLGLFPGLDTGTYLSLLLTLALATAYRIWGSKGRKD